MGVRTFHLRMQCRYEGSDNAVAALTVEHRVEDRWQPFELGLRSPGFEIFVYAVFTCQHMYFRVNCAERGLVLDSADGTILIAADDDWTIDALTVKFVGQVSGGMPAAGDVDYIVTRMKQCPVSRNIRELAGATTTLELV